MYEVIWSHFYDRHIVRKLLPYGIVGSLFFGTEAECNEYVACRTA